jgi:hypothetical protein
MGFKDLLVQPLQRLTRYPLLLKTIASNLVTDSCRSNLLVSICNVWTSVVPCRCPFDPL